MKINWVSWSDNSSEADALIEFIRGGSLRNLKRWTYSEKTLLEIQKIKPSNLTRHRKNAGRAFGKYYKW